MNIHTITGTVLFRAPNATDIREAVEEAVLSRADLSGAYLSGADLSGARLSGARLSGARLSGARLSRADLTRANLRDAYLSRADLRDAYLSRADLSGADLARIQEDVEEILASAPAEVPGLLGALREGRIDGSVYEGECACLVVTLAKVRGCHYMELGTADMGRPAERWALAIRRGDTPASSQISAITVGWVEEWLAGRGEEA